VQSYKKLLPVNLRKNLIGAAIAAVVIALLIFLSIAVLNSAPETDRIYIRTYIHGVPVGGLSAQEAEAALMERFQPGLDSRRITYYAAGEVVAEFAFADFGARFNFGELVQEAVDYSNRRSMGRALRRANRIDTPPKYIISQERMESVFTKLSEQIDVMPKNATFMLKDGRIVVMPESTGRGLDIQALSLATEGILTSLQSGVVEITMHTIPPVYTTADFQFTVSVLGSFRTKYTGNETEARVYNVNLASDRINNQVLFPGEVFSAGAVIGANKPNSGYKAAIVLVQGEPVEDIGGGVCQVVSTLYNAVLAAELQIVQRHNHSAPVSYVEKGFDATVAGDYFDLKFKNDTQYPILISSQFVDGELRIAIHGHENRPPGRSIRFSASRVETVMPGPYREIVDASMPLGERYIVLESQMGFHVELLKHVYVDGNEVEVVKINTSIYKPLQGVIAIGAG